MKNKAIVIISSIILCILILGCQRNATELVVESQTDNYTIQEVYIRKAGTYHVYVKMLYYDLITTYATSFSTVTISEGESKFVYVRGIQLLQ